MKFYYLLLLFTLNISAAIAQQESIQIQKDESTVDNQKIQSEDDLDVYLSSKQYQRKKNYLERRKNSDGSLSNIDKNNYQALRTYKKIILIIIIPFMDHGAFLDLTIQT